jgi:signal peptidase I
MQFFAATILIAIFVITFLVQAFQIPSESMENTLLIGDYLLVDKVQFGDRGLWGQLLPYHNVNRGDIVVFKWPVHPQQHFVKRVIAIPGDRVRIVNGRVFVNGQSVPEQYAIYKAAMHDPYRDNFPNVRYRNPQATAGWWAEFPQLVRHGDLLIPEGSYFVLGDNRDQSLDSRYWGLVPRESIVGKPLLVYLSLQQPPLQPATIGADDKIGRFAYSVWHLPAMARWNRTLRFIQ